MNRKHQEMCLSGGVFNNAIPGASCIIFPTNSSNNVMIKEIAHFERDFCLACLEVIHRNTRVIYFYV